MSFQNMLTCVILENADEALAVNSFFARIGAFPTFFAKILTAAHRGENIA